MTQRLRAAAGSNQGYQTRKATKARLHANGGHGAAVTPRRGGRRLRLRFRLGASCQALGLLVREALLLFRALMARAQPLALVRLKAAVVRLFGVHLRRRGLQRGLLVELACGRGAG